MDARRVIHDPPLPLGPAYSLWVLRNDRARIATDAEIRRWVEEQKAGREKKAEKGRKGA